MKMPGTLSRNLFCAEEPDIIKKPMIQDQITPQFGFPAPFKFQITPIRTENPERRTLQFNQFTKQDSPRTPKKVSAKKESPMKETPAKRKLFGGDQKSRFHNEYIQIAVIGKGNFGTVYKCINRFDNQTYAVKCTKNWRTGESINEAQALAFLTCKGGNKNIIRYHTAWIEGSRQYLVMEYCDFHVKDENNEWFIKAILRDIASGLKYLHEQKMAHLDIKPENLLFSRKDRVYKIADLGLSRIALLKKGEDITEGDSRYLAPEVLNNVDNYREGELCKADIFSLGASLYELMSGIPLPRNGDVWTQLRSGITVETMGLADKFSYELRELICEMMNPNCKQRISAKEICERFVVGKDNLIKWERVRGTLLAEKLKKLTTNGRKRSV